LKSDGVIVSTATGSTAYSASAGGPIVEPSLNAFVFTPINSFSLSSRPIVLNGEGKIEIVIQPCRTKEICMIVDGQEPVTLQTNDKIIITTIEKKIKLICSTKDNFYNALRSKMNWSGGPHA
jgi:NAD+ kinase